MYITSKVRNLFDGKCNPMLVSLRIHTNRKENKYLDITELYMLYYLDLTIHWPPHPKYIYGSTV